MKICTICNCKIQKNDTVIVLAYPIKILSDKAEYNILQDFLSKQILYHYQCFVGNQQKLLQNKIISIENGIILKLYNILLDFGEKIHFSDVENLYFTYPSNSLESLIKKYYELK